MTGLLHWSRSQVLEGWKQEIFAVLESQLNRIKGKGRKRDMIHISESESDDELPPSKKGKHIPVQLDQLTLGWKESEKISVQC